MALGLPPQDNDGAPAFDAAIARVTGAAQRAGKVAATLANSRLAKLRISQGFRTIAVAIDLAAMSAACAAELKAARS